ncbi:MAG: histidine--tRNA ligase [Candidatus Puniceispirillaceae bacterium]
MQTLQPVRGTSDLLPAEKARHNHVIATAKQIASHYGFQDMATPIFEFTDVFRRPLGDASDVVSKETYSFEDRGGTELTLRPENTAAVMRAVISNGLTQTLPQKYIYSGPMFRYERPQKGRMRQFHQIGVELIGPASALADAEVIGCGADFLEALGVLSDCRLHLNSLGDGESRTAYRTALVDYLTAFKEELSEDSQRRLSQNPLRILDSKDETDRRIIAEAPVLSNYLNDASKAHYELLITALDKANISYVADPMLVRGLDYYCHTAFEFITDKLGAQGTVLGGGRYDGLAEMLGGPHLPSVGFAAGIERLALLIEQPEISYGDIVLVVMDADLQADGFALATTMRQAGLSVDMPFSGNISKKLKRADKIGARYAVLLGSDEFANNEVQVKSMATGQSQNVAISELVSYLI